MIPRLFVFRVCFFAAFLPHHSSVRFCKSSQESGLVIFLFFWAVIPKQQLDTRLVLCGLHPLAIGGVPLLFLLFSSLFWPLFFAFLRALILSVCVFSFCVLFFFSAHQRVCGHLPVELSLDHFWYLLFVVYSFLPFNFSSHSFHHFDLQFFGSFDYF